MSGKPPAFSASLQIFMLAMADSGVLGEGFLDGLDVGDGGGGEGCLGRNHGSRRAGRRSR